MSSVSTFGAFTTARLGIYAAQKGLDVTGHNIANINTVGYTRQQLDQISFKVGGSDRYQPLYMAKVGQGVFCTGVSQLRDPYLDIRYRNEQASVGAMDTKLAGLEELASILDEVGKGNGDGVIEKQLTDLITQLQNLNTQGVGQDEFDNLVKSSATTLVGLFNTYAGELEKIRENQEDSLKGDIETVNEILQKIAKLNESIRASDIHGDGALELRDERNLLIDQLSQYMKIDVIYSKEQIGAGREIEHMTIRLAGNYQGNTTEKSVLLDGNYCTQLSIKQVQGQNADGTPMVDADGNPVMVDSDNFDIVLAKLTDTLGVEMKGSQAVELGDNDLYGGLQASRELLTEMGEFSITDPDHPDYNPDPDATTKRGIPYYQKALDALANQFAKVLNEANTGYQVDENGNYLNKNGDYVLWGGNPLNTSMTLTDKQKERLAEQGIAIGGALFSNSGDTDDTEGITAANISIAAGWADGATHILTTRIKPTGGETPSQANENLAHILSQMTAAFDYRPSDIVDGASDTVYFSGSFQQMLTKTASVLANDQNTTTTMLNTYAQAASDINTSRDSVSGVDLNDEAANLMMYQKSYAAACRLMTTLDEALDKLINGTGVVGR